MPLKPITSHRLAKPVGPFSPAVRPGPTTGKLVDGGVVAQTEQIFATSKRSWAPQTSRSPMLWKWTSISRTDATSRD